MKDFHIFQKYFKIFFIDITDASGLGDRVRNQELAVSTFCACVSMVNCNIKPLQYKAELLNKE